MAAASNRTDGREMCYDQEPARVALTLGDASLTRTGACKVFRCRERNLLKIRLSRKTIEMNECQVPPLIGSVTCLSKLINAGLKPEGCERLMRFLNASPVDFTFIESFGI